VFRRWQRDGTWAAILTVLQSLADAAGRIVWDVSTRQRHGRIRMLLARVKGDLQAEPQPGLLDRVLGLGHAAEDPVGDREQQRPQLFELLGPGHVSSLP